MEYQVKIDAFEGPLDLLLYLMKEMKISIDDINVSQITAQYINFIHEMEKLNLEVASEYLVMAAHLLYIKSKMMLPKKEELTDDNEYEENPEEKLKNRLKLYKLFKEVVPLFQEYEETRSNYLTKIPTDLSQDIKLEAKEVLEKNADVYDLLSAFNRVLRRFMLHKPLKTKIEAQSITIEERISQVKLYMSEHRQVRFTDLYQQRFDKEMIVVTFMAVLELAREKTIAITQDDLFEEIYLNYLEVEGVFASGE